MPVLVGMRPSAPHATPDNLAALLGICLALKDVRDVLADSKKYDGLLDRLAKVKGETETGAEALAAAQAQFAADKKASDDEIAVAWKTIEADQKQAKTAAATAYTQMAGAQDLVIQGNKALDDAKAMQAVLDRRKEVLDQDRDVLTRETATVAKESEKLDAERKAYEVVKADLDKRVAALAAARKALG